MKYDHASIHSFIHLFSTYVLSSRDGQALCSGDTEVNKSEDGENLRHAFILMNIQSLVMWVLQRKECGPWVFMVKEGLSEKGRVKPWVRRSLDTNLILSFSSFKFLSCPQSSPAWPDPCLPPQCHAQPLSLLAVPVMSPTAPTGGQGFLLPQDQRGYASPTKPYSSPWSGWCFLIS